MGYGISNIRTAAEAVATTKNWEFDYGFKQGINERKTTKPFISMLNHSRSKSPTKGRQENETYVLNFILYEAYPFSDTRDLDVLESAVRADLLSFCKALCTDTLITVISPDYDFTGLDTKADQCKDVACGVEFTVQVTNCI